jgi:hypothetical protein
LTWPFHCSLLFSMMSMMSGFPFTPIKLHWDILRGLPQELPVHSVQHESCHFQVHERKRLSLISTYFMLQCKHDGSWA